MLWFRLRLKSTRNWLRANLVKFFGKDFLVGIFAPGSYDMIDWERLKKGDELQNLKRVSNLSKFRRNQDFYVKIFVDKNPEFLSKKVINCFLII